MTSTARASRPVAAGAKESRAEQRRAATTERAAVARREAQRRQRTRWGGGALAALAVGAGVTFLAVRGQDAASSQAAGSTNPYVGGDLHTVTAIGDRLYVGGHDGTAVSTDGGKAWTAVPSLRGADAMGWAQTPAGLLAGGHPGLYRSTDGGTTFTKTNGPAQVSDVHALGASGSTAYLASPRVGLLVSSDGGASWQVRNPQAGKTFMGTLLVDPADPQHLIAPDMQNGLVASADSGHTWTALGGPQGAMSVAWDPTNTERLLAVGMAGGAFSNDGGRTWTDATLPAGTSAATFSPDGATLYAAGLDGSKAQVQASADGGKTWTVL